MIALFHTQKKERENGERVGWQDRKKRRITSFGELHDEAIQFSEFFATFAKQSEVFWFQGNPHHINNASNMHVNMVIAAELHLKPRIRPIQTVPLNNRNSKRTKHDAKVYHCVWADSRTNFNQKSTVNTKKCTSSN